MTDVQNTKRTEPKKQFSKWMARIVLVFWVIYLPGLVVLMFFRPEVAMACVYLTIIATVAKTIDGILYTHNSETEKILLTALDKTRIEVSIGNGKRGNDDTEEGGSNG